MIRKALIVAASALVLAGCVPTAHYSSKDPQRGLVTQASDTANKGARYNAPVLLRIIKETKQLETVAGPNPLEVNGCVGQNDRVGCEYGSPNAWPKADDQSNAADQAA